MNATIRPSWNAIRTATRNVTTAIVAGEAINAKAEKVIVADLGAAAVAYAKRRVRNGKKGRATGRFADAIRTAGDVLRFRQWLVDAVADGKISDKELADLAGRTLLAAARGWAEARKAGTAAEADTTTENDASERE